MSASGDKITDNRVGTRLTIMIMKLDKTRTRLNENLVYIPSIPLVQLTMMIAPSSEPTTQISRSSLLPSSIPVPHIPHYFSPMVVALWEPSFQCSYGIVVERVQSLPLLSRLEC
jgi:hypothetical protein